MVATVWYDRRRAGPAPAPTARCDADRLGLSREEEIGLAKRVAAGDQRARDRLIESGLGLIPPIARGFLGRGLEMDDLIGEAHLGLIRAAEKFDPRYGIPFHAYATCWIKWAIRTALIETASLIRLPAHMVKILSRWRRAEQRLLQDLGRVPSFDEVASSLGLGASRRSLVLQAQKVGRTRRSAVRGDDPCDWLADEAAGAAARPEEAVADREEWAMILSKMERLEGRERTALTLYFGLGCEPRSFQVIGEEIGLSRETSRLLVLRALRWLGQDGSGGPPRSRRGEISRASSGS